MEEEKNKENEEGDKKDKKNGEKKEEKKEEKGKEAHIKNKKNSHDLKAYNKDQRIPFISNKQKDNLTKFNNNEDKYSNESINGRIKIYDMYKVEILFEGEYLNGKRNGKCKEYVFYW